jgi:Flp pilus assembly protein protease CpaA
MPFSSLPVFALVLGMAGGGQALATLGARRLAPASVGSSALRRRMPYGVSIAVGGLAWAFAQVAG